MSSTSESIEGLYREHGQAILGYLRRIVGEAASAEDLLQETFVQALAGADRLAETVSPRAWLFGIARNLGANTVRRRRIRALLTRRSAARLPADPDPRVAQMRDAIAGLPRRQREALELRLHEDLTYAEIAAVVGVPVGTVRSRLHYAVRRLREIMREREQEPSEEHADGDGRGSA